jgi:hypothetical protein
MDRFWVEAMEQQLYGGTQGGSCSHRQACLTTHDLSSVI